MTGSPGKMEQPKIRDILGSKRTISFEFYPPRSEDGIPAVLRAINRLAAYNPDFISVTYGAGGSTRAYTEEIVTRAKDDTDLVVMSHLTCVGQTKEEIHGVLDRLANAGIENIIALRGDAPQGQKEFVPVGGGFAHATDLIEYVKSNFEFGIAGACYPEGHTESPDMMQDIEFAKRKVELGADFLISQLLFDNNDFYNMVDKARQAGITVPIVAGVLPILSTSQIRRFTSLCGSKIPQELDRRLEEVADDDDAARQIGIEYATNQVRDLWENGVEGIHFYVLNRSYSVANILDNLALPDHVKSQGDD